jgi:hypothetical protein
MSFGQGPIPFGPAAGNAFEVPPGLNFDSPSALNQGVNFPWSRSQLPALSFATQQHHGARAQSSDGMKLFLPRIDLSGFPTFPRWEIAAAGVTRKRQISGCRAMSHPGNLAHIVMSVTLTQATAPWTGSQMGRQTFRVPFPMLLRIAGSRTPDMSRLAGVAAEGGQGSQSFQPRKRYGSRSTTITGPYYENWIRRTH